MSEPTFPDGTPVSEDNIFGYAIRGTDGILVSADSLTVFVHLPETDGAENFESGALDFVLELDDQWQKEAGNSFRIEIIADRSFEDEFTRARSKKIFAWCRSCS